MKKKQLWLFSLFLGGRHSTRENVGIVGNREGDSDFLEVGEND